MSELNIPEHWAESKLGELVDILDNQRKPISANKRTDGIYPYYGANGIQGCHNEYIFSEKLLLVAEDGGHFGSKIKDIAYIVDGKYWVNNHAHVLRNKDGINLNYLFQYLRRFNVKPWVTGATVPKLNQAKLRDLPVVIPPKGEQERIVQKIESCFQKIDETEKALNEVGGLLTKYRESLLAKAFRGELVPQDPKDEPASKLLEKISAERAKNSNEKKVQEFTPISDDEKPFDLPKGWEWVNLEDVCTKITDGVHQKPNYTKAGIPFISVKDVTSGKLLFKNTKFISVEDHLKFTRTSKPEFGDILYTKVGATYGRPAIIDIKNEFSIYVSVALLKPVHEAINSNYLFLLLKSPLCFDQAVKAISGAGVPDLHLNKIRKFKIPLPSISEQIRIINFLNTKALDLEKIEEHLFKKINVLRNLKESIFSKAFEGALVPRVDEEGTGQELLANILENMKQVSSKSEEKKVTQKIIKNTAKKKAKK